MDTIDTHELWSAGISWFPKYEIVRGIRAGWTVETRQIPGQGWMMLLSDPFGRHHSFTWMAIDCFGDFR